MKKREQNTKTTLKNTARIGPVQEDGIVLTLVYLVLGQDTLALVQAMLFSAAAAPPS